MTGTGVADAVTTIAPNLPKRRYQKGALYLKHGRWYAIVESSPTMTADGSPASRKQRWVPLASESEYPHKDDVYPLFAKFMALLNDELQTTDQSPKLLIFIERTYLPALPGLQLAPSTIAGYKDVHKHIERRLGEHTLASFRPIDVSKLLEQIVAEDDISKTTVKHIKHYLSGIFTYARNHGYFDGANPVSGVKLPKARGPRDTYAYSLKEEQAMMKVFKNDLRALSAIATASWSGMSMSELEGLRWEDRRNGHFFISRSVVEGVIKETKTEHRKAPVPIIKELANVLDRYWRKQGSPAAGWIFPSENPDKPIRMMNLFRRHMESKLKKAKLTWRGWHAFRRGLATNLDELGVPIQVIQKILRHGDEGTTRRFYRKTRDHRVVSAMERFQEAVGKKPGSRGNVRQSLDKRKRQSVSY